MKPYGKLMVVAALTTARVVVAGESGPDPQALGTSEAILSYCARVNPSAEAQYQEQILQLTRGASGEVLAGVRNSAEYRQAHEAMEQSLAAVSDGDALKACTLRPGQKG